MGVMVMFINRVNTGEVIARIVKGGKTIGYVYKDYINGRIAFINTIVARNMAYAGELYIAIGGKSEMIYADSADRLRVDGKLKLKDLPEISERKAKAYKANLKKVTPEIILNALKSGYNQWYKEVCNSQKTILSVDDLTWRLDTYLSEKIGLELALVDNYFKSHYTGGIFSLDNVRIDFSTKEAYDTMVKIVKTYHKDYQLPKFIEILSETLNELI